MPIQIRNTEIANLQSPDGFNYGLWTEVIAGFQAIPGLVGFWPMSSIQRSTGNVYDLSGQGRNLTYNVGVGSFLSYTGLVPFFNFAGGGYLSRADETDLDILGSESFYASSVRGLTQGGWFWFNELGGVARGLIGKSNGPVNQRGWILFSSTTNTIYWQVSSNGTATVAFDTGFTPTIGQWYHIVSRYVPSTSLDVYINGTKYTYTTSIPASIFNSTANFEIAAFNAGVQTFSGRISLCFLCANNLSDSIINGIYQRSRLLFGV